MKTTLMELEEQLEAVLDEIENYVPETKWEAANCRYLKRLHVRRKSLERAAERQKQQLKYVRPGGEMADTPA